MLHFRNIICVLVLLSPVLAAEPFLHKPVFSTEILTGREQPARKPVFNDPWTSRDKGLHFSGSLILTTAVGSTSLRFAGFDDREALRTAVGFTLITGITKELWDASKVNNRFSYKDLCFDILGAIVGGVLLNSD